MGGETNRKDFNKMLFSNLIMMLGTSAMQQLGKLVDPLTNKAENDLQAAQLTIDTLVMLKEKTKGNLDRDEDKALSDLLSSLQLTYVETAAMAKAGGPDAGGKETPESHAPAEKGEESAKPEDVATAVGEAKDPKFHKSYGA